MNDWVSMCVRELTQHKRKRLRRRRRISCRGETRTRGKGRERVELACDKIIEAERRVRLFSSSTQARSSLGVSVMLMTVVAVMVAKAVTIYRLPYSTLSPLYLDLPWFPFGAFIYVCVCVCVFMLCIYIIILWLLVATFEISRLTTLASTNESLDNNNNKIENNKENI